MTKRLIEYIDVSQLHFDPNNPRFGTYEDRDFSDQETIIEEMIDREAISELIVSIADQGYFSGEPLLVFEQDGKLTVAEGNRRLSALKILNGEISTLPPSILQIIANAKHKPKEAPCIVFQARNEIIHYLGYRHITGVKSWGALEKAIYLKQLKEDLKINSPNLTEDEVHITLAREIGSHKPTVAKSLTALGIYEEGRDPKTGKFYQLQRVSDVDVDFSIIYTALSFKNVWRFLGIESSSDTSLNNLNTDHTKELFSWLFAEDDAGNKVVRESRQLPRLNHVLGNEVSLNTLRETRDLDYAYDFSDGAEAAFRKLIDNSRKSLKFLESFLSGEELKEVTQVQLKDIDELTDLIDYIRRLAKRKVE